MACNIITDLYIIWLPMPMLFKSTLPMATKIALATLFGCGIFVTIAGILRVTYIVYVGRPETLVSHNKSCMTDIPVTVPPRPPPHQLLGRS
jgi:hypothetical protein